MVRTRDEVNMKISYHLMIEQQHLIDLKHKAVDDNTSVNTLIINALTEKYKYGQIKEKTSVRKKRRVKKNLSG